jgi:hypothetical protein
MLGLLLPVLRQYTLRKVFRFMRVMYQAACSYHVGEFSLGPLGVSAVFVVFKVGLGAIRRFPSINPNSLLASALPFFLMSSIHPLGTNCLPLRQRKPGRGRE